MGLLLLSSVIAGVHASPATHTNPGIVAAASALGGPVSVNYSSSVDGWPLSYSEWLPAGFDPTVAHPLVVFLHGQQATTGTWVAGGLPADILGYLGEQSTNGKSARALVAALANASDVLIAPNSRSGAGWYVDSPCGGPQQQDLMDAIVHEEAVRNVSAVYLVGVSMGTEGVLYTAALHPGLVQGIGLVTPVTDLFEDVAYREFLAATQNASDPWAYDSIQAKARLFCGVLPGTGNASEASVALVYQHISPLRFDPEAFAAMRVYVVAGGEDDRTPNNVSIWSPWMNANNTFVNSTCNVAASLGEPANCSQPLGALHLADPQHYAFRFVYEPNGGHGLTALNASDLLAFWTGAAAGGYYLAHGDPPGPITPAPGLAYGPPLPTAVHTNVSYASSIDAWPLSYDEWLPPGYDPGQPARLVVYLHGAGSNTTWVAGGTSKWMAMFNGTSLASGTERSLLANASVYHYIFVSLNTRSDSGFYVNSPCGGPQYQDLLDAIANEQRAHRISGVFIIGSSMGGMGAFAVAGHAPGLVQGIAVSAAASDLFEEYAFLARSGKPTSHDLEMNQDNCGVGPGTANATVDANFYTFLSPRFYMGNLSNLSVWASAGGLDQAIPNNVAFWPYLEANASFVNSTCLVVVNFGEPPGCTSTWPQLAAAHPGQYRAQFDFEPTKGHDISQLVPAEIFGFFANATMPPVITNLTFDEQGLPNGTAWSVTIGSTTRSSTSSALSWMLPAGTYDYAVGRVPGFEPVAGSSIVLNGSPTIVTLDFRPATLYPVNFDQSGLAPSAVWQVTIAGTTATTNASVLTIPLPNGTYPFLVPVVLGYRSTTPTTSFAVAGAPVTVNLTFESAPYFAATFTAVGLPAGTPWRVVLDGGSGSTTGPSLEFNLTNGSYAYAVDRVAGFEPVPAGVITINGSGVAVNVTFTPSSLYPVIFSALGLGPNATWELAFNGTPTTTNNSTITFVVPNGSYPYSVGVPAGDEPIPDGTVAVAGTGVAIDLAFRPIATFAANFSASGLPSGVPWSVSAAGAVVVGVDGTASLALVNGTYPFTIGSVPGFSATPRSGTVTIAGAPTNVSITFTPVVYAVTFTESGLAKGVAWSVTLHGVTLTSTTTGLVFSTGNGSAAYTVGAVTGYVVPPGGTVVVNGSAVSVGLAFVKIVTFVVKFTESGLKAGVSWSVTVGGTTASAVAGPISVSLRNGTYAFTIARVPGYTTAAFTGTVTVAGKAVTVATTFVPVKYTVTFTASGLAVGTTWKVTSAGVTLSSSGKTIVFQLVNGTYAYTVAAVTGYATPAGGTYTVAGNSVGVAVAFAKVATFALKFTETGLPAGTSWSVTVNGTTVSSTSTSITMKLPSGTYSYSVAAHGFVAKPASGTVKIGTTSRTLAITFSTSTGALPGPSSAYPSAPAGRAARPA